MVYDLDTKMTFNKTSFPIPFDSYFANSFILIELLIKYNTEGGQKILQYLQHTRFRVIPCKQYLQNFSSDRTHMYNKDKNEWYVQKGLFKRHHY